MHDGFIEDLIKNNKCIYLVGIGGVSMSGIASILLDKGFRVSGSDIQENDLIVRLKENRCKINIGHNAENIDDTVGVVVYTAAVNFENNEIKEALRKNIPLISRSEFLGELTKRYDKCITISGTHGKTSTTSMFSYVMIYNDLDPTILLGGELDIINGNFRIGKSEYLVMEACEYKESFLNFSTDIGVILNIEKDHLDYYKDLDHIKDTFSKYVKNINKDGCLIYCDHDQNIKDILNHAKCRCISYGIDRGFVRAVNIKNSLNYTMFDVLYDGVLYKDFKLNTIGKHNILNALASISFSFLYDLDINKTKEALSNFSLPKRRFEIKGVKKGVTIIEDYAHHPTEIKAAIEVSKSISNGKIFCFFQPHTYSRTIALFDEFSESFSGVDELILLDIYAAREKNPGTITSKDLGDKIRSSSQKCYNAENFDDAVRYVKDKRNEGDVFLIIGAGDIWNLSNKFMGL